MDEPGDTLADSGTTTPEGALWLALCTAPDEGADVAAVLEPETQQLVDAGDLGAEPVTALAVARAGLVGEEGGAVLGGLDGETPSPGASVLGDDAALVEQAHLGVGGDEREDAARGRAQWLAW